MARAGQRPVDPGDATGVRIHHTGYLDEAIHRRDKIERNLRLADTALASGEGDQAMLYLNLARAQVGARKLDEALPNFERAAELATGGATRRAALRAPAEALVAEGRGAEARQWIERLRAASTRTSLADFIDAQALIVAGNPALALTILERLHGEPVDDEGTSPSAGAVAMATSRALREVGRPGEAADLLLALVGELGPLHGTLTQLQLALRAAGRSFAEVASVLPPGGLLTALAELLELPPEQGDELLEALWAAAGDVDPKVLAAAIRVAPRLGIERALEWSARIRAAGLEHECPLVALATDPARPAQTRVRAAALAAGAFGDQRGVDAIEMAATAVDTAHLAGLVHELAELAPDALGPFVVASATDAARALALARPMHGLGATNEAVAVLDHGLQRPGTSRREAMAAADWLAEIGLDDAAESLREQASPASAV